MDAPAHFGKGKWRLHQIPFERLAGDAVVIDITKKASENPDATVDVSDLKAWEKKHGHIPDGAVIVMYSGWGEKYSKHPKKYFGATIPDLQSNPGQFWQKVHFPGFGVEAAKWLIENRNIHGILSDTMSLDCAQCGFRTHKAILNSNIWGLENTANVHKLRPAGYQWSFMEIWR